MSPIAVSVPARPADAQVVRFSARHLVFVGALILLHVMSGLAFVVGSSPPAISVLVITAFVQVFGVTTGYHRLLAHRSFRTSRPFQFILALCGALAGQNGPLWWAGHHRYHHRHADQEGDIHSPRTGVFWSHMGWLFSPNCIPVRTTLVADLARLPELRLLQEYCYVVPIAYAFLLFCGGEVWRYLDPTARTSGSQLVVWGSVVSTVCVYHIVWSVGSLGHLYGTRPFETKDNSRNNIILSVLLLGDGWHNNHHYYPRSAKVGFRWWEFDFIYAILKLLACFGIVWALRLPPSRRTSKG
jgi:stearoyl-CoA desaturase (delta-9 desaturase)